MIKRHDGKAVISLLKIVYYWYIYLRYYWKELCCLDSVENLCKFDNQIRIIEMKFSILNSLYFSYSNKLFLLLGDKLEMLCMFLLFWKVLFEQLR